MLISGCRLWTFIDSQSAKVDLKFSEFQKMEQTFQMRG